MKSTLIAILFLTLIISCQFKSREAIDFEGNNFNVKYSEQQDTLLIGGRYYNFSELNRTTPEFLRYARNEIFARKGYIFKDSCLAIYFKNQDWYKPTKSDIVLTDSEKEWVKKIKEIENNYSEPPSMKLIKKFDYAGIPLFYIATGVNNNKNLVRYRKPYLVLLDSSFQWTLKCDGLPPELLLGMSSTMVQCDDDSYAIKPKNLNIINFDSLCTNGESPEIIARLYGPSSDDYHAIYGYDKDGKFGLIVSAYIQGSYKFSDSIIAIETLDRHDRIGTAFSTNEYYFNTIERTFRRITPEPNQYTISSHVMADSVALYSSSFAARKINKDSIIHYLYNKDEVQISHFIDKDNVYLIESEGKKGWIEEEGLHSFFVGFAD